MTRLFRSTSLLWLSLTVGLGCGPAGSTRSGAASAGSPTSPRSNSSLENLSPDDPDDPDGQVRRSRWGTSTLAVACDFDDGWYAAVPVALAQSRSEDEFLMQALIGLTQETEFWSSMEEYEALQPFAAARCGRELADRELPPRRVCAVHRLGWTVRRERISEQRPCRIPEACSRASRSSAVLRPLTWIPTCRASRAHSCSCSAAENSSNWARSSSTGTYRPSREPMLGRQSPRSVVVESRSNWPSASPKYRTSMPSKCGIRALGYCQYRAVLRLCTPSMGKCMT